MKVKFEKKLDNYEQIETAVCAYTNKREWVIQEYVSYILSSQWLKKISPSVVFANSNFLEKKKKNRIFLSEEQIVEPPQESTNVLNRNMIDRYIDRRFVLLGLANIHLLLIFSMLNF